MSMDWQNPAILSVVTELVFMNGVNSLTVLGADVHLLIRRTRRAQVVLALSKTVFEVPAMAAGEVQYCWRNNAVNWTHITCIWLPQQIYFHLMFSVAPLSIHWRPSSMDIVVARVVALMAKLIQFFRITFPFKMLYEKRWHDMSVWNSMLLLKRYNDLAFLWKGRSTIWWHFLHLEMYGNISAILWWDSLFNACH